MRKVYNKILNIVGNVITVKATDVSYEELAEITSHRGKSLAQVIKLDGDLVSLQVFAGSRGISINDEIRFLGHPMMVTFSDDMLDPDQHSDDRCFQFAGRFSKIADIFHFR